ncbi:MAG TPA: LTA synthase family protein, partial [Flavobacterium sp.]|nr:LTA synthase family protein [Flavobacterium sp.]
MKKLYFLKPLFNFMLIGLAIMALSRLFLFFLFKTRVEETPSYGLIFPIGLRFDLILLCYLSFLPALLICLLPDKYLQKIKGFLTAYFVFFLIFILLMEMATPNFMLQYDTRPNRLFLDYLIYPKEVIGTLVKSYLPSLIITFIILSGAVYLGFK